MAGWWRSLNYVEQFYHAVAILSVLLMGFLAVLVMLGMDTTIKRIEASRGSVFGSVRLLSFPTVNGYLLGLGWGGILCLNLELHLFAVILLSNGLGLIFMGMLYIFWMSISGLHFSSRTDVNRAIGGLAQVLSTIPANRKGRGSISVKVDSEVLTFEAETGSPYPMKPGDQVRVVERIAKYVVLVKEK